MKEVYSALLLHSAGLEINEENIKKVLQAIGSEVDEGKIKALVASLEGVNIDEILKEGIPAIAPRETKEEKKEEKKEEEEEKKEEEAIAGLGALFG